jgi:periplasmic protein TonB
MRIKRISFIFIAIPIWLTLILVFVILINISSCGRKSNKVGDAPPSLLPPQPPKPPSMVEGDTIWNFAGQLPSLPGNEEALFDYIGRNLRYPDSAKANGVQGKVIVKFCVTRSGNVKNHEVIKSVSPELDAEALRVIKTITTFEPGYKDGKAISVWYEVPISFVLR